MNDSGPWPTEATPPSDRTQPLPPPPPQYSPFEDRPYHPADHPENDPKKPRNMAWIVGAVGFVLGAALGTGIAGSDQTIEATAPTVTKTATVTAAAKSAPTVTKTVKVPVAATAPSASLASGNTCADAREAILTGSQSDIEKALKALIKDKSADQTAREAAQDYFNTSNKDLKGMDIDLVQMSCQFAD